jgi:ribose transport system permease protein
MKKALPWKAWMTRLDPYRGILALAVVFLLCILFSPRSRTDPGTLIFLTVDNLTNVFRVISVFGLLATGMTLVIITAGIDLSVGSLVGLCATLFSFLLFRWELGPAPSILLTLGGGAACGLLSGLLISVFRIQPFVATLAMMVSARGAAKWISEGEKIMSRIRTLPDGTVERDPVPVFEWLGARIFDDSIAVVSILFLITIVVFHLILSHTPFGRALFAIGGNEEAARLSGIRVKTVKTMAYVLCGLLAGLAGMCQAAQDTYGNPDAGIMYELSAIAAVVIGGTSLMGGRGGMGFTLIGVMIIGFIENILRLHNVESHKGQVVMGALIVIAVLLQQRRHK